MQLLSVLGVGFLQGLYALDAADGESENASAVCTIAPLLASSNLGQVIHVLVQGLLQSD